MGSAKTHNTNTEQALLSRDATAKVLVRQRLVHMMVREYNLFHINLNNDIT